MPENGRPSKFARLVTKLRAEGYSDESAHNIAAGIERRKYGQEELTRRAAEGRERAKRRRERAAA